MNFHLKQLLETRTVYLRGSIDDEMIADIIDDLNYINSYDRNVRDSYLQAASSFLKDPDVLLNNEENFAEPAPIFMHIDSGGGSALAGFALIDVMKQIEAPIITVSGGMVGSMALGIFVSGDYRLANIRTRFMYHQILYGMGGKIQDHHEQLQEAELIQNIYDGLYEETDLTPERRQEVRRRKVDFFFSGHEALDYRIADELLIPKEKDTSKFDFGGLKKVAPPQVSDTSDGEDEFHQDEDATTVKPLLGEDTPEVKSLQGEWGGMRFW